MQIELDEKFKTAPS